MVVVSFLVAGLHSVCFFFFKQKTAYEMRISDWSSDVCSSDLRPCPAVGWREAAGRCFEPPTSNPDSHLLDPSRNRSASADLRPTKMHQNCLNLHDIFGPKR